MTDTRTPTVVSDAAALGQQVAASKAIPHQMINDGLIVRVVGETERIQVVDLEHTLDVPNTCRGSATLYDPADFAGYVNRLSTAATTMWACPGRGEITAVFDDHTDGSSPGWRAHRATFIARRDPEWMAWLGADKQLRTQEDFAEFIEEHLMAIVDPEPAVMLEVATSFQARRAANFERATRLQSGDVQLRWVETTTASAGAKGHLEVPERFTVRVAPFLGVEPAELQARLRYRINDGHLRIGFTLHRPDVLEKEAFDRILEVVTGIAGAPMLGDAPQAIRTAAGSNITNYRG